MQFFDALAGGRKVRDAPINWEAAKAELLRHPGQWWLIAENVSSSTAHQLRTGKKQFFRGPEMSLFEFRVRKPTNARDRDYASRLTDLYGRSTLNANEIGDQQ